MRVWSEVNHVNGEVWISATHVVHSGGEDFGPDFIKELVLGQEGLTEVVEGEEFDVSATIKYRKGPTYDLTGQKPRPNRIPMLEAILIDPLVRCGLNAYSTPADLFVHLQFK